VFESTNVAFQMGKDDTKSEQSLKMAELETRIVGFKAIAKAGRLFLKEGAVMCTTKPNSFVRAQVLAIARALSLSSGPTTCSSRSSDLAYFT